jgi:S-layer homology domain
MRSGSPEPTPCWRLFSASQAASSGRRAAEVGGTIGRLSRSLRPGGKRARGAALMASIAVTALLSAGCCKLVPWALAVDPSLTGNSDGNGVFEPGETVVVAPSWSKSYVTPFPTPIHPDGTCSASDTETGTATSLAGPIQADYVVDDAAGSYPTFGPMRTSLPLSASIKKECTDCYELFISVPMARPVSHWDASFRETLGGTLARATDWRLHIGDSFTDVPRSDPFYLKIETLLHRGVTSGCSPTEFCPGQDVSRGQIAVFIAKGIVGTAPGQGVPEGGLVDGQRYWCVPGGTSLFTDVAPTDMFCKHIHLIAARNVDSGCDPGLFCPGDKLTRLQMATFVANALVQPGGDAAVPLTYQDPVTGLSYSCDPMSPNLHFTDMPVTGSFCKDANYLWARGIIAGCSATEYCPEGEVTRDQMAKFIVNAFRLTLYGP